MFGPYEIECDGRKYVGNVSLKEFHKFHHDGDVYLFNVETMAACRISEETSRSIDRARTSFGNLTPLDVFESLMKYDLIEGAGVNGEQAGDSGDTGMGQGGESAYGIQSMMLLVVQECNMGCIYCYGDGGSYGGKGFMTVETAFGAVDWLFANAKTVETVRIFFFGGEPLLNFPVIKEAVQYAKARASEEQKKIEFSITTNGSLLTEEILNFIRDERITVLLSFDGSPRIQNTQRPFKNGKDSYPVVHSNIRKLLEVSPGLMVRGTVHGDADPQEIKKGIQDTGVKTFLIIEANPIISRKEGCSACGAGQETSDSMAAFRSEEYDEFYASVKNRSIVLNNATKLFSLLATGKKRHFGCGVGKQYVSVSVAGDIYPCHRFVGIEDVKLGTIRDYKAEGVNDYHRSIVHNLPKCSVCWARYLCGGGCFYINRAQTGDMRVADPAYCNEHRAATEKAIRMCANFDDGDMRYLKQFASNEDF